MFAKLFTVRYLEGGATKAELHLTENWARGLGDPSLRYHPGHGEIETVAAAVAGAAASAATSAAATPANVVIKQAIREFSQNVREFFVGFRKFSQTFRTVRRATS